MAYPDEHLKAGDTSPKVQRSYFTERDIDTTGVTITSVRFYMAEMTSGNVITDALATIENVDYDVNRLTISYDWTSLDTGNTGEYKSEFRVEYSDGKVETFPKDEYIHIQIDDNIV